MALSIPQMARMSQLLEEALALDEGGRRVWLERATQEHPDLAAALREALLPGAAQAADLKVLMSLPKLDAADEASATAASGLKPGARVGPYELIRRLGAGGMAEVWLARRADGAFRREVALKLPMLAHAQAGLEARFARERDILASLEHPHIARLYDAGVGPEGLPYLSMEYVQGEPLTDWSDAHRLGIPGRLALFLQVLEAVQYAHEKKVIHRDLKPSNILVTESGQVRLLDFGVARLLEGEETDQPALTSVYGRALTPDYASPELLRGDPIDARSDLYSLGVLLYELLTGTRPYRLKSAASIGALDQAISTLEVRRPSLQLEQTAGTTRNSTVERLARQLRGDLDAVVLKTLAKEPALRYPSAAALTEDLRRYLDGRPIQAQPARRSYRLRKFVLRNGTLLGVGAAALTAIVVTVGYALYRESHAQVTVSAKTLAVPAGPSPAGAVAAFAPPPHSIAVLPFVNLSGDKEQEYFSDGLTEELLNSLSEIDGLQVAARTSSFSFKEHPDIVTVAHKLNVGAVLEGSVRRSANTIRISAQLINAVTGFHLWSKTYDRDLGDVLKLQTEIATAVAGALKLTLLGDVAAKVELGGTRNPAAFDAYLRGAKVYNSMHEARELPTAITAYTEAIRLDPHYALAFAGRSMALSAYAEEAATGARENFNKAQADARRTLALAPDLAEAHLALAWVSERGNLDFTQASEAYDRAVALAPGNAPVLRYIGLFSAHMGHFDAGVAATRRAVVLDPLAHESHYYLSWVLYLARRYEEAVEASTELISLEPDFKQTYGLRGLAYYGLGDPQSARASCETKPDHWASQQCLAVTYDKLGRHADAEAVLSKMKTAMGNSTAYQYATIYAQWGNRVQALEWLETALRLRDPGLVELKTDPLMDPLRNEPRFQAIERGLKFPPR
jgi:serine/threonine protein kinase/TolB-like protein/tetratricopeptide (TPR) repeat protein